MARKQCFLVCLPSVNMARKQCFLVCLPSVNMARKQCFLVCPVQERWLEESVLALSTFEIPHTASHSNFNYIVPLKTQMDFKHAITIPSFFVQERFNDCANTFAGHK